jgi:PncC family amidohydrolase
MPSRTAGSERQTLVQFGAVSMETAREMAEGVLANSRAQVAFAITGIAGSHRWQPGQAGGDGLLRLGWPGVATLAGREHFEGDRRQIRAQSVRHALGRMLALMT